jgi:plastocyanin
VSVRTLIRGRPRAAVAPMRTAPVLATAALTLAVAGCGGGSKSDTTSSAGSAPATTSTAVASAKPKQAAAARVSVKNFDFAPTTLTVKAGSKVTWKNGDATNHTVTFNGGGAPSSVDNLAEGASVSRTFPKAGTYSYVCTFHPNMKAKVVVTK